MKRSIEWTADRILFREIAEATSLLAWITEADGYCTYLSPTWYEFTGASAGESEGYGWLNALHPDDQVRTRKAYFEANDSGLEYHVGYRLRRATDDYALVWAHGMPRFEQGQFVGYLGITKSVEHYAQEDQAISVGDPEPQHVLSAREREVLALIAQGNSTDTVAAMLGISARTVDGHASKAAFKLGASNRVHTVAKAMRLNEI